MKLKNKNQGTALLVTVLLAGAIGAIAFGIFKIANSELSVGTKDEEGIEAFYAAEAGVEDALMRFKFIDSGDLEIPVGAREDTTQVDRIDINSGLVESNIEYTKEVEVDVDKYIYDLKVWYKMREFTTTLKKDESVVLDVSDFKTGNLLVSWKPKGQNTKLWYRLDNPAGVVSDPRQLGRDFFTYLAYPNEDNNRSARNDPYLKNLYLWPNRDVNFNTFGFNTLKFKAFGDDNSQIELKVWTTKKNLAIGGPNLYIESTGYYGDTARKLKVTVDRASKSVLDIFDYVIYSDKNPLP